MSQQLLHRETKTATSDATLPLPDVCAAALRLRKVAVTMEIYAQASSRATRSALKRLGDSLSG